MEQGKRKPLVRSPRRNRGPKEEEVPIKFGTYNIRNGMNGGLEAALRGMEQANMDLGVIQETKITDGVYTRTSAGYRVVATDAPSRHRSGIALFYKEGADFAVEEVRPYGPNVISFEVVVGEAGKSGEGEGAGKKKTVGGVP